MGTVVTTGEVTTGEVTTGEVTTGPTTAAPPGTTAAAPPAAPAPPAAAPAPPVTAVAPACRRAGARDRPMSPRLLTAETMSSSSGAGEAEARPAHATSEATLLSIICAAVMTIDCGCGTEVN